MLDDLFGFVQLTARTWHFTANLVSFQLFLTWLCAKDTCHDVRCTQLTLVEDQYWAVRELARGKVSVAKLRWTMLRNLLKKNGAAVFRDGYGPSKVFPVFAAHVPHLLLLMEYCSGKAASGPGLRSLMDVTQFVSRKKEMMRVFVNRSARQRDHAAVGGKQLRRCGSASTLICTRRGWIVVFNSSCCCVACPQMTCCTMRIAC